jgi:S1-C subfamily serine protease
MSVKGFTTGTDAPLEDRNDRRGQELMIMRESALAMRPVSEQRSIRFRNQSSVRRRSGRRVLWVGLMMTVVSMSPCAVQAEEQLKPKVEERVRHATLFVRTFQSKKTKNDTYLGAGSGYFVNGTGLLITNNHVVDPTHDPYDVKDPAEKQSFHYKGGKLSWTVTTDSGTPQEKSYDATVVYQNEQADQAVVQAYEKDGKVLHTPHYLPLQPESKLHERMNVWGAGFPGAEAQGTKEKAPAVQIDPGNLIAQPRSPGGRIRRVYTDVIARPGNSGGPQVDQDGRVVGTATLMTSAPGREDQGGAREVALVPAALTAEMIRNAYKLKKIPPGTDFTPFLNFLSEQGERIDLPEFDRRAASEVLFFANGDRVYGRFVSKEIKLETELGNLTVPTNAIAYLMTGDGTTTVHLEGGNRISVSKIDPTFPFEPDGGRAIDVKYADVSVISFRTEGSAAKPVTGKVSVVDGNLCRLLLSNIDGAAKFTGAAGTVDISLENIDRIESDSSDNQVITLRDDRRMTGKFEPVAFRAMIAATGTPVEIALSSLKQGYVESRFLTGRELGGLGLGKLVSDRADFRRIAQTLESSAPEPARAALDKLLDKNVYTKMPTLEKDRLKLLDSVELLRAGKYAEALKGFRMVTHSEDKNAAVFANAYAAVLKKYENGQFNGKPLSDRAVFADAGTEIAKDQVLRVRTVIRELRSIDGDKKNDFVRLANIIKNNEENISLAGVFLGTVPEDLMLRMWKIGQTASSGEFRRLGGKIQDFIRPRGGGAPGSQASSRESAERQKKAFDSWIEYVLKRIDYGFFVEDIDIEEILAQEGEREN